MPQPVIIAPQPVAVAPQPVYMWVRCEHRKNWSKHCRHYNACGVPVYFIRHDWYDQHLRSVRSDRDRDDDDDRGQGRRHHRAASTRRSTTTARAKSNASGSATAATRRSGSARQRAAASAIAATGEFKEKYRDGPCEIERDWKRDGSYKEKLDCKGSIDTTAEAICELEADRLT